MASDLDRQFFYPTEEDVPMARLCRYIAMAEDGSHTTRWSLPHPLCPSEANFLGLDLREAFRIPPFMYTVAKREKKDQRRPSQEIYFLVLLMPPSLI